MSDAELRRREQEQALAALRGVHRRRLELDESEHALITNARDCGLTWGQVAEALGLNSPQVAQQRHERLAAKIAKARNRQWWSVDHGHSDSRTHTYCAGCVNRVPGFLVRHMQPIPPPYLVGGEPARCEGCGREAPPAC